MDELLGALAESIGHAGPQWCFALGVVAIAAWLVAKALPVFRDYKSGMLSIEERREERKAEEAKRRDDRDREMAKMNGQWIIVSEQSAKAMEGMTAQMQVLNATLSDSKDRSREMGRKIDDIHDVVVRKERKHVEREDHGDREADRDAGGDGRGRVRPGA